jgi:hypothetical protein
MFNVTWAEFGQLRTSSLRDKVSSMSCSPIETGQHGRYELRGREVPMHN